MTVAAETNAGTSGAGVTGKAKIPVVIVPRSMTVETSRVGSVDRRISSTDPISVTVASGAGTGKIISLVAGSAVLHIRPRRITVVISPAQRRVVQRHSQFV